LQVSSGADVDTQTNNPVDHILEPAALADELTNGSANTILVHVASAEAYAKGHIDGAVHVAPGELVSGVKPATGTLPDPTRLRRLFERIGYRPDARIIVYDDEGGGWAGRFIWTLDIIGHTDWWYLNGGIHAWAGAGLPLQRTAATRTPTTVAISIDRGPIAETKDILERLGDPKVAIWDCRSSEEFDGRRVVAARGGHIPGAVHLDWLDLMDPARQLRLRNDLEALLRTRGISRDKEVIVHCQTHHRSGLAYLVARALGFPNIRGYHGSWSEWGNRTDTPVETGR
jgi:thiosulfate/3-mercaptopyruvate sulfurtransferase